MASFFRIFLLFTLCLLGACYTPQEAREQRGIPHDSESQIPETTPGPGIEKVQNRPNATPTPRPSSEIDKPLDPTGLPQQ